jgi:phenylalanyl-tRNA synthetase beta chain
MKISLHWLRDYIELPEEANTVAQHLTGSGLEVESVEPFERVRGGLAGVVVGEVLTCVPHPNADKLRKTTVDVGAATPLNIVCGAPNVAAGQKVLVALVGTTIYPTEGEPITLKKAKIRGEASEGMICAEDELGLGKSHAGILVLQTELPNGTPAADYFDLRSDEVFEIGLTPNRADAASHIGVARDLRALLQRPIRTPDTSAFVVQNQDYPVSIKVENTEACPRYAGVTISGVTVAPSPEWLQQRLKAIGLSPINNIVDISNYVLHEMGQPLHTFDADKIQGRQVIVTTLPEGTPFVSLDGQTRSLSALDLVIADGNRRPMCLAGVFGGVDSGITAQTRNVFLECAYFSPEYIRRSSLKHGLKTDASFRFERGVDPNQTVEALKRAALLIQELAGGTISMDVLDLYPQPIKATEVTLKYAHINRLIGVAIPHAQIQEILQSLDIQLLQTTAEELIVAVPPYRVDVQREADVIEEILRIYGYDNVPLHPHASADYLAKFPVVDANKLQQRLAHGLVTQGFLEIMTNTLTAPRYADAVAGLERDKRVYILNKLSEELEVMRQTPLFSGLEAIAYNINRRQKDLRFFEFGKAYHRNPEADAEASVDQKYRQQTLLSLWLTGNSTAESWQNPTKALSFHEAAGVVVRLLEQLNLQGQLNTQDAPTDLFEYGLTWMYRKHPVAKLGLVKKSLAKQLDIKQEVWYAELDWDYLSAKYRPEVQYQEVAKFPEVRRDLSLVLDKHVSYREIEALAYSKERKLLKQMNVFDVYEGDKLDTGKKAYAISFILQDEQQTLTDKVIDKTMQKLMQAFEEQLGAFIRK